MGATSSNFHLQVQLFHLNVMITADIMRRVCVRTSTAWNNQDRYIPRLEVTCPAFHLCTRLVQAASGSSLDYLEVIARGEEGREARNKINTHFQSSLKNEEPRRIWHTQLLFMQKQMKSSDLYRSTNKLQLLRGKRINTGTNPTTIKKKP